MGLVDNKMVVRWEYVRFDCQIGKHEGVIDDDDMRRLGFSARFEEEAVVKLRTTWSNAGFGGDIDPTPGCILTVHKQQFSLIAGFGRRQPKLNFEQRPDLFFGQSLIAPERFIASQAQIVATPFE